MRVRTTCIIHYAAALVLSLLTVLLAFKSCHAWKLQSHAWEGARQRDSGNYAPAGRALSTARSYRPDDPELLAAEAHMLSLQGRHKQAVSLLTGSGVRDFMILKLALASERLAVQQEADAQVGGAIAMLEDADRSRRHPGVMAALGGAYLRSGDLAGSEAALDVAAQHAGELTFDGLIALYINSGMLAVAKRDYEAAARQFKKAMELLPERGFPPLRGEREEASRSARRGLALTCMRWLDAGTTPPDGSNATGYLSALLAQRQASRGTLRRRWNLASYRWALLNALGVAQMRLKLHDKALKTFDEALKGMQFLRRGEREQVKARIVLNRALAITRNAAGIEGPPLKKRGELTKAAGALAEAADSRVLPGEWRYRAHNLSARCYMEADYGHRALRELKDAIALSPSGPVALVNLAVLYDRRNNRAEALKLYREALKCESLQVRKEVERRIAQLEK